VTDGDGILHTVTYRDPQGPVKGLGVAAHRDDEKSLRLAEEAVRVWSKVMRTRRVLTAATGPTCAGLRREAAQIAQIAGPVAVLATAASRDVPLRWPGREVRVVEHLADVPDHAAVVVPAHGVDPRTATEARAMASARGLRIVDATCPLVTRAHATARGFADDGATVVVIGGAGHVAVPPLAGQATESVVVTSVEEIDDLTIEPPAHIAFVVSPGLAVEDAGLLAARLRVNFAGTIGQHPDEFCYAASDRRAAVRAVASCSELTLVLGDPESADTRALTVTATAAGTRVEQLDDVGGLRPDWLGPAASVGVVVGLSARPELPDELVEVLSGLGPLSVTRREVTTDVQPAGPVAASTRRAG
jgi:4-hydroxy-3-methylbut-2-enyl diphosphate reductase